MTEEQIREAGAAAVTDFPPLTDEVAARLGALLADLDKPTESPATASDTKAA